MFASSCENGEAGGGAVGRQLIIANKWDNLDGDIIRGLLNVEKTNCDTPL